MMEMMMRERLRPRAKTNPEDSPLVMDQLIKN
jgi:hypothetical protein